MAFSNQNETYEKLHSYESREGFEKLTFDHVYLHKAIRQLLNGSLMFYLLKVRTAGVDLIFECSSSVKMAAIFQE